MSSFSSPHLIGWDGKPTGRRCEHGELPSECDACAATRTARRKALIAQTKAERAARAQRYRANCFYKPAKPTMEEEPSWGR